MTKKKPTPRNETTSAKVASEAGRLLASIDKAVKQLMEVRAVLIATKRPLASTLT